MRKTIFLFLLALGLVVVSGGPSAAFTENCNRGGLKATNGSDVLYGTAGEDVICGMAGKDRIYAKGGDDKLKGDRGVDRIVGGAGDDKIKGGMGRDTLLGRAGHDILRGGSFRKVNDGKRDVLDCGSGVDTVYFTPGVDVVRNCEILNPPS
ncbi:MAG: calcium-binding protein [Rubrobacteraceae bacterium]